MLLGNESEVIERIKNEATDIDKNIGKLSIFLDSEEFEKLPILEKQLMYLQKQSMLLFSSILHTRILAIGERYVIKDK